MKNLSVVIALLPFLASANVDMIMGDSVQDELIISWSLQDTVFAGKYVGGEFTQVVTEPGLNAGAVGIATDNLEEKHILFAIYTDDEMGSENDRILSHSYNDFAHESTYYIDQMEHERIGFLKSEDERWDALLAHTSISFCSSVTELYMLQSSFSIGTNGTLTETATGSWDESYYFKESDHDSELYPAMMAGPVACPGGNVLVGTSFGYNSSSQWLVNHTLMFDPDSSELLCYTLGEDWNPEIAGVMGLGCSSDTDAILLYSDNTGEVNWSSFTALSPVPETTNSLPWDFPGLDDPIAFTSTFEQPGMLMVWYRDGEIRCRHWDGQWNNYDYLVANSMYPPDREEIAVCAYTDGYWVTWLPGAATEPEVVFVSASDVTSVSDQTSSPVNSVPLLRALSNPVNGQLLIEIHGVEDATVTVSDISGRVVINSESLEEGTHSLGELPASGVYFIRMHHSSGEESCKVISVQGGLSR